MAETAARIRVLQADEARDVTREVHALREAWEPRKIVFPFHTLGAASYLDAVHGRFDAYAEKAQRTNPLLRKRFSPLLDAVETAIAAHVGERAFFDERLALPGFHVFLGEEPAGTDGGSIHFDFQYKEVDWSAWGGADTARQISFTLPVALPKEGAGLRVWPVDYLEMAAKPRAEAERIFHETDAEVVRYTEGEMVVHSGHHLHQATFARDPGAGEDRITLQGHGLPVRDGWILYW